MNRAQRRRQSKQDQTILLHGLNLKSPDADAIQALARQLYTRFEKARRDGDIDAPVKFFQSKINASLRRVEDLSLACKKGCSHCCYVCVSATAPEVLFIAKIVRRMGPAAIARVRAAHDQTKAYDFYSRYEHPHACPLLKDDLCTVYETRPGACRFAASRSAEICARAYHNLSDERIPAPTTHLNGSSVYSLAMAAALKRAGLAYHAYELNAALVRAIDTDDAQRTWLSGADIFSGVPCEPTDIFSGPIAREVYERAFGQAL